MSSYDRRATVYVNEEQAERLRLAAEKQFGSVSSVVRQLIEWGTEKLPPAPPADREVA